jgi:hypothetical protein
LAKLVLNKISQPVVFYNGGRKISCTINGAQTIAAVTITGEGLLHFPFCRGIKKSEFITGLDVLQCDEFKT